MQGVIIATGHAFLWWLQARDCGAPASPSDFAAGLILLAIHDDLGAFRTQAFRRGPADALPGTGDDADLVRETFAAGGAGTELGHGVPLNESFVR